MHGLQEIRRINNAAAHAYAQNTDNGKHLLNAPPSERFDFNIPWKFKQNLLHVYIHEDTRAKDLVELYKLVEAEIGYRADVRVHYYS